MSVIEKTGAVIRQDCCRRWLQFSSKKHQSSQRSGKTKAKNSGGCKKAPRDDRIF